MKTEKRNNGKNSNPVKNGILYSLILKFCMSIKPAVFTSPVENMNVALNAAANNSVFFLPSI
ncbi:hypothetical protein D3C80_1574020 [compost metagenome]